MVRSYRQPRRPARERDVPGERWSLLMVRELLDGPRGYNALLDGLPGIATNLLADRLRSLAADGVIRRRNDGRYELTPWGVDLREAVYALGRWAGPLMAQPRGDDHFQVNWLRHMVVARFDGHDPRREDLTVELSSDDGVFTLLSADGRVRLESGPATAPDVTLEGPLEAAVGVLLGRADPADAARRGVRASGDVHRLPGLCPRGERAVDRDVVN
ncbi:winged helix-turn-helix transcriptional regulator [soil metagenome]